MRRLATEEGLASAVAALRRIAYSYGWQEYAPDETVYDAAENREWPTNRRIAREALEELRRERVAAGG